MRFILERHVGSKMTLKHLSGYLTVGTIAAFIDFGVLIVLLRSGLHYLAANTAAFLTANIFNFLSGHYIIFEGNSRFGSIVETYSAVLFISIAGLVINNSVLFISVDVVALDVYIGKAMAMAVAFFWNFGARKRWVYESEYGEEKQNDG